MLNILTVSLLSKLFSIKSQKGVTMIEYALIAALVAAVIIAVIATLGGGIEGAFDTITDALNGAG